MAAVFHIVSELNRKDFGHGRRSRAARNSRVPELQDAGRARQNGTGLKCDTCHRVYPIKDDIPVMLIDEATIEN